MGGALRDGRGQRGGAVLKRGHAPRLRPSDLALRPPSELETGAADPSASGLLRGREGGRKGGTRGGGGGAGQWEERSVLGVAIYGRVCMVPRPFPARSLLQRARPGSQNCWADEPRAGARIPPPALGGREGEGWDAEGLAAFKGLGRPPRRLLPSPASSPRARGGPFGGGFEGLRCAHPGPPHSPSAAPNPWRVGNGEGNLK